MKTSLLLRAGTAFVSAVFCLVTSAGGEPLSDKEWTHADLAYGKHPRQRMDVWLPGLEKPAPVVMFVHGGGWTKGMKREKPASSLLSKCRAAGCAFVAVEYRTLGCAVDERIVPPVRAPMADVAAAVEFVQSHAEKWRIDPKRIGMTGGSAGACSSLSVAFADGNKLGVRAVAAAWPQTSLDPVEMRAWIPNITYGAVAFGYPDFETWLAHRKDCLKWISRYSPAELLRKCPKDRAPMVFTDPAKPQKPGELPKDPTHAGAFRTKFGELCAERGVGFRVVRYGEMHDALIAFLKEQVR